MTETVPLKLSLEVVLQQALAHHRAGRLSEAEDLYRAILLTDPAEATANYNLGVLAGQVGQHVAGLPHLKAAVDANPAQVEYWLSYAEALLASGYGSQAAYVLDTAKHLGLDSPGLQSLRRQADAAAPQTSEGGDVPTLAEINVLSILFKAGRHADLEIRARSLLGKYPDFGPAWKALGLSLQMQGKDGLPVLEKAVKLLPDDAEARLNLANALHTCGRFADAVASYRRALEIKPDFVAAHINMGNAWRDLGQFDDAIACYRRVLEISPDDADAYYNLGTALQVLGRPVEAAESLRQAIKARPDLAAAHYNLGVAVQAIGRFDDAAASYRRALNIQPGLVEAHNNLGVVLRELGQLHDAVTSCRSALLIRPDYAEAHDTLGNALKDLGLLDEATASYARALAIRPDRAETHSNLGNALKDLGQLDEAVTSYRRALAIRPDLAKAHSNLGNALRDLGQLAEAVESYCRALAIRPDLAEIHSNLGNALRDLGRLDHAVASYGRALAIKPDLPEAHINLGNAQKELGQVIAAVASYRRALSINDGLAEAHSNLGNALKDLGEFEQAATCCRRALELKPDLAEAHSNLGNALQGLGQLDEAIGCYQRALQLMPDLVEAHVNLGNALKERGQTDDAVASYRRALQIRPDYAEAHNNLGNALKDLGQLDDALASFRRALEIRPAMVEAYTNMLYLHACTRDISPELECSLATSWERIVLNDPERKAARARFASFGESLAQTNRTGRRLKIGVVSAEIGQHAVAEFLEPLLEQIDRSRFHVTLYPTTARQDLRAARFAALADAFRPLIGISDKTAAASIRSDRIDVLIDTTAYMRGCRLGIFAHRAAPVQCHYIGYHGSTGLTEMDWFIADGNLLPPSCDSHFRERVWRLPRLWISYRGDASLPESAWQPSSDGSVRLGSFNNFAKIRHETLALWARVMNVLPESRLLLKDRQAASFGVKERLRMQLGHHGIGPERIEFAGHLSDWRSHMSAYDNLDIALDTIPLNSGTTAFDALWMGVPLVALEGNWMGGRMSSAILTSMGRAEWVARDEEQYASIVVALAHDVAGRRSLRASQRSLMAGSALCDAVGLTRALEEAFEALYDRWLGQLRGTGGGSKESDVESRH